MTDEEALEAVLEKVAAAEEMVGTAAHALDEAGGILTGIPSAPARKLAHAVDDSLRQLVGIRIRLDHLQD